MLLVDFPRLVEAGQMPEQTWNLRGLAWCFMPRKSMSRGNGTGVEVFLLHSRGSQLYSGGLKAGQWLKTVPEI